MFCPACGSNNDDQARFCYKCGRQLNDGTEKRPDGPAWRDFVEPQPEPEPPPPPPPDPPPPPPPDPPPPQVVVGKPKRELPIAALISAILGLGIFSGAGYGILYAVQNLDFHSLPFIGDKKEAAAKAPPIVVSLTTACKDTKGQDCNLEWDITKFTADDGGVRVEYDVSATGQSGCTVNVEADEAVIVRVEANGRPGPYLEGARGRYYPLLGQEGITTAGGEVACGGKQSGAWKFPPVTGESFIKFRYPGLPPARIELDPLSARVLPADDPPLVIPLQQPNCQTAQQQPCRGSWEIGPYGLARDGVPAVFFAVRFESSAPNCQINWQKDIDAQKALLARGDKGIRLQLPGGAGDLAFSVGGGLSGRDGPLDCNTVYAGFWRFTAGNISQTVDLLYPDIQPVQIPIRP